MKPRAFKRGGIHPHDFKHTTDIPITKAHIPKKARILMSQHIGSPAKIIVKVGDKIEEGQLIGEATGFISANIHASVSGKVTDIGKMNTPTAKNVEYVEIETGGSVKNWYADKNEYGKLKPKQLLDKIQKAGIVGMGGATFPTHVKLAPPSDKKIDALIINGAECEPYLTIDNRMMIEAGDQIIEGIKIVMKILKVKNAYIGIEENKPTAIQSLIDRVSKASGIEVILLRTRYPQGGEKQLIEAITGKQVPTKGLPADIGVVVLNVFTVYAIFEAIAYDKPLIERGLTFSGDKIKNIGNYKVRIGTPIQDLLDEFEMPAKHGPIIAGGPMMGHEITDTSLPVGKGSSGLLVLGKKKDYKVKDIACIRCARCYMVCPIGLEPALLARLSDKMKWEEAGERGLMDCIECGACSFVCPSTIPIVGLLRFGKGLWRRKQKK